MVQNDRFYDGSELLEGVRLNSAFFGGFDWSRLSTTGLHQLEIVRGPYSALWGADAVGGVVNLLIRRAEGGFDGADSRQHTVESERSAHTGIVR